MRRALPPLPPEDVEQLLLNARLRDALEPYDDESWERIDRRQMTTAAENQLLAALLAWEQAPILPIGQWFEPPLAMPSPATLDDTALSHELERLVAALATRQVFLECTEHLSDRQLYGLLLRDVLPTPDKKLNLPDRILRWRMIDEVEDGDTWLRYYATERERRQWTADTGRAAPPAEQPPYPRNLPQP